MSYLNISGYIFKNLSDLQNLKSTLAKKCHDLLLKGTILLSEEGINAFLSGTPETIDKFCTFLDQFIPGIAFKKSMSQHPPFKRMLVKIKPEIVTFGVPDISPEKAPAPYISPEKFKEWLDHGKAMVVLDTRNEYEVRLGKFKNAISLNIQHFRHFPKAANQLQHLPKDTPIVTYCTGGIRCEKAAPFLMNLGFTQIYQLEGGILKYLERCGGSHYEGHCFVFDERLTVDHALQETTYSICTACGQPVDQSVQQQCSSCSNYSLEQL